MPKKRQRKPKSQQKAKSKMKAPAKPKRKTAAKPRANAKKKVTAKSQSKSRARRPVQAQAKPSTRAVRGRKQETPSARPARATRIVRDQDELESITTMRTDTYRTGGGPTAGGQAGDVTGLSRVPTADSESVEELVEEGQDFEAEIVSGVEDAPDADQGDIKTHEDFDEES
jgi:hypothetical protein